jgi:putative endonuclease
MPWVYILRCADSSYYVGSTRGDIETRVWQHSTGHGSAYTGRRLPVELVFAEQYPRVSDAYAREKQLQGWSRRKREALIDSKYASLPSLSRKHFSRGPDS